MQAIETERTLKAVDAVVHALLTVDGIKTATKYVSKRFTVRGTWTDSEDPDIRRRTISLSIGEPNYAEREFIKDCGKAGVTFPVRKVHYKFPPKRRGE